MEILWMKSRFSSLWCFVLIWPSNDLQVTFLNDQSGRVPLPNLKNKKLHILIPHLLQMSVYNQSYGEKCYPYPPILSPKLTRYWMCIFIFQPLSRPSIVIFLSLEYLLWVGWWSCPKMLWCWTNYQLDSRKILAYGNIMNEKQILSLWCFDLIWPSNDLYVIFRHLQQIKYQNVLLDNL